MIFTGAYRKYKPDGKKKCTRCGERKNKHEFHRNKSNSDGLESFCKKCRGLYARKWEQQNSDRRRGYNKTYREQNREKRVAITNSWKQSNPEKYRAHTKKSNLKNRIRRRELRNVSSDVLKHIIWCKSNPCSYCGSLIGGTYDHVIPFSRGGPTSIENLVPACQKCNDSKGVKTPEEWVNRWYE